ncbi:hypothetical protein HMPREF0305_12276 [Corynebacterium pseudogenitalium ATCC 33035]|uniref:Uncharacterized protein n=1 Tax=Corynebacterium pseudogenitalium ATCC 33035 TaxID=525264 RepID=E2S6X4_9CORY|nr:hypothetical protein HMPREF0305_12276 [Corynebacterium pseudogenitalium ATCC 33035]
MSSGLDEAPSEEYVYSLMQHAAQFLDESEAGTTFGSFAA